MNITREQYEKLPFRHQVAYMEQQLYSRGELPVLWNDTKVNRALVKMVASRALAHDEADLRFLTAAEKWAKRHNIEVDLNVNCRCCEPDIEKYLQDVPPLN